MIELMPGASDRWLKRVWLTNGITVLALLLFGAGALVVSLVSDWSSSRRVAVAAPSPNGAATDDSHVRAVRFDIPAAMRGTNTQLVIVRNGSGELQRAPSSYGGRGQYGGEYFANGPMVNVIFLTPGKTQGRLLFDRPAYLTDVSYPATERESADSLQTWIIYRAVLTDTNGDGKLDVSDEEQLLISDLDGGNLTRVLPEGLRLKDYKPLNDYKTLIITAYELPKPGERRFDEHRALERAFTYDVPSRRLESLTVLDSLAARAGRMVGSATR